MWAEAIKVRKIRTDLLMRILLMLAIHKAEEKEKLIYLSGIWIPRVN